MNIFSTLTAIAFFCGAGHAHTIPGAIFLLLMGLWCLPWDRIAASDAKPDG